MRIHSIVVASMLLAISTTRALADAPRPERTYETHDADFDAAIRDDRFVGVKVHCIRAGGRFDQPTARFQNGDIIEAIALEAITSSKAGRMIHDIIVDGREDATVSVRRNGKLVELHSKARR